MRKLAVMSLIGALVLPIGYRTETPKQTTYADKARYVAQDVIDSGEVTDYQTNFMFNELLGHTPFFDGIQIMKVASIEKVYQTKHGQLFVEVSFSPGGAIEDITISSESKELDITDDKINGTVDSVIRDYSYLYQFEDPTESDREEYRRLLDELCK